MIVIWTCQTCNHSFSSVERQSFKDQHARGFCPKCRLVQPLERKPPVGFTRNDGKLDI